MNAVILAVYFIDLILIAETSFDYCFMESELPVATCARLQRQFHFRIKVMPNF